MLDFLSGVFVSTNQKRLIEDAPSTESDHKHGYWHIEGLHQRFRSIVDKENLSGIQYDSAE